MFIITSSKIYCYISYNLNMEKIRKLKFTGMYFFLMINSFFTFLLAFEIWNLLYQNKILVILSPILNIHLVEHKLSGIL